MLSLTKRSGVASKSLASNQMRTCIGRRDLRPARAPKRLYSSGSPVPPLRIVIFGPPGGGKGTQCEKLQRDYNMCHISTGNLLRRAINEGTQLGNKVKEIIERGDLVDDATMLDLVTDILKKMDNQGWVLDGFPRTEVQAMQLDQLLRELNKNLHMALWLDVPDEVIIERISQRLTHIPSGRIYHRTYKPPKQNDVDDITGEPLVVRPDDREENVRARLEKYHKITLPMLKYYSNKNLLVRIKANTSHEGYIQIQKILDDYIASLRH